MITQMLCRGTMFHLHVIQQITAQKVSMVSSKSQRWFKGPSFLSQPEDQWPNQISAEVSEGDPEIKLAVTLNVITIKQDLLSQLWNEEYQAGKK